MGAHQVAHDGKAEAGAARPAAADEGAEQPFLHLRRNARCSMPHSAISTKSSAPAMVVHSQSRRISGSGYNTLAA
jgi:hypothetical protein